MSRKSVLVGVGIVIILEIGMGLGYLVFRRLEPKKDKNQPILSVVQKESIQPTWTNYTDPASHISFSYPTSWGDVAVNNEHSKIGPGSILNVYFSQNPALNFIFFNESYREENGRFKERVPIYDSPEVLGRYFDMNAGNIQKIDRNNSWYIKIQNSPAFEYSDKEDLYVFPYLLHDVETRNLLVIVKDKNRLYEGDLLRVLDSINTEKMEHTKEYQNEEYGFSISYPSYLIQIGIVAGDLGSELGDELITYINDYSRFYENFFYISHTPLSVEEVTKILSAPDKHMFPVDISDIVINGVPGKRISFQTGIGIPHLYYIMETNKPKFGALILSGELDELNEKIMQSIRFF